MAPEGLLQSIFSRSSIEKRYFLNQDESHYHWILFGGKGSVLEDLWFIGWVVEIKKINVLYRFDNIYKNLKNKSDEETLFFI